MYFTGRYRAREQLTGWITDPDRENGLYVVTGGPGSGKSALIAWLLALGDPRLRDRLTGPAPAVASPAGTDRAEAGADGPVTPPVGWASAAVRASGLRLDEITARLAAGLAVPARTPGELVSALADRPAGVLVVDAVDEAADDPLGGIRDLLVPLAEDAGARVLVGSRRGQGGRLLRAFGSAAITLDLDDPALFLVDDLVRYAARSLRLDGALRAASPYRADPEATARVAAAIAAVARPSFLITGLAARARAGDRAVIDTSVAGWEQREAFPNTVGAAMDDYLQRLPDPPRAAELLVPVAYARGAGLPRDGLWADLADAYSGRPVPPAELDRLLDSAAAYLLEVTGAGEEPVVRLFHQALTEHVRGLAAAARVDATFTDVLTRRWAEAGGWLRADRYTRRHLAAHAAGAGRLDALLEEPGFLATAQPEDLVAVLPAVTSGHGRHIASIYRRYAHALRGLDPVGRASQLEFAARQAGDAELAGRFAGLPVRLPWRALWARWELGADHIVADARHELGVQAVAVATLRDGTPVVVSGGHDGSFQVCHLDTGVALGPPVPVRPGPVSSLAVGRRRDGTPVVVTGGAGSVMVKGGVEACVWDLQIRGRSRRAAARPPDPAIGGHRSAPRRHAGAGQRRRRPGTAGLRPRAPALPSTPRWTATTTISLPWRPERCPAGPRSRSARARPGRSGAGTSSPGWRSSRCCALTSAASTRSRSAREPTAPRW